MDVSFVKFLFFSIIEHKDTFDVAVEQINAKHEVRVKVALSDMKRIIGCRGRLYRAIKLLLKCHFKNDELNLIIDVWGE